MEKLKTNFTKNEMIYNIIDRSDNIYLAEVFSESNKLVGYEIGRIIKSKESTAKMGGVDVTFQAKERIVSNEMFGRHEIDMFVNHCSVSQAKQHFNNMVLKHEKDVKGKIQGNPSLL